METFIYALIDPFSGEIRYVGKSNDVAKRYANHIHNASYIRRHSSTWISSLKDKGELPILHVLEKCCTENWVERERWWIKSLKELGQPLTNHAEGGEGTSGNRQTEIHRQHISESLKGRKHSEKHVAKVQAANIGKKRSEEIREKFRQLRLGKGNLHITIGSQLRDIYIGALEKNKRPGPEVEVTEDMLKNEHVMQLFQEAAANSKHELAGFTLHQAEDEGKFYLYAIHVYARALNGESVGGKSRAEQAHRAFLKRQGPWPALLLARKFSANPKQNTFKETTLEKLKEEVCEA